MKNIEIKPIGQIKKSGDQILIEIDKEYLPGLKGLEDFSHAQIVWWGHLSDSTENRKQLVLSKLFKKGPEQNGVFSTRAPMRPNPVLISTVKIQRIDSEKGIFIQFIDAEPGTPVLDIKPYQPMERVKTVTSPKWCRHWPKWQEEAAQFNWAEEINF
ncbi:MAG: SAM-dependent methyltransferase [Prolixibacteraceae bacterium]|nr:SAM-dependent methyltransferase [Prolixibacteraceae bacterium]